MKSGKYLVGGLIRGPGGAALKSFMKSDLYKGLKKSMIKRVDKLYSKRTPIVGKSTAKQRDNYLRGLKKLDLKNQKALIIERAMKAGQEVGKQTNIPRKMQAALLRGARGIRQYKKKIEQKGKDYLIKGERMVKGQKDN